MTETDSPERRVHRAFRPSPLTQEDIGSLYVDMDDVRGQQQPVEILARKIEWAAAGEYTCQLLAGHRGSGKSTELARLRQVLETKQNCFVVSFSADDGLDRNDVDVPDLLLAVARVLCEQVHRQIGVRLGATKIESFFAGLKSALKSELNLTAVRIKSSFVELSEDIKASSVYRRLIRQQAAPAMRELVEALNDLISEATLVINRHNKSKLVLMVDDLDKLSALPAADGGKAQPERLFIDGAQELTSLRCDVIYTVPLDLAYAHHGGILLARYDGALSVLPMVRVRPRQPGAGVVEGAEGGVGLLRNLVRKRLQSVELAEEEVFAKGILDRLIRFSGGQPHELMNLISSAALLHGLPIGDDGARRVEVELRRHYRRMLMAEYTPLLQEVRDHGELTRDEANERYRRELLSSRAILLYMNGEEWYGLNPALEDAEFPRPPEAAP
jgi:hypothetical protein